MVQNNRAFVRGNRTGKQCLIPEVVCDDHIIRELSRLILYELEPLDVRVGFAGLEFAAEKLRHNIVDVEDDFRTRQFGVPGGEHQKIGHVVNVDQVVFQTIVPPR